MRKIYFLPLLLVLLTGCSISFNNGSYSFTELSSLNDLDESVQEFFIRKEQDEDKNGNGIFTYKDSKDKFYLYLSPKYIAHNGKNFTVDVKAENDSFEIYITNFSPKEDDIREYRVYEVNLEREYEYLRIYEVHNQVIGN